MIDVSKLKVGDKVKFVQPLGNVSCDDVCTIKNKSHGYITVAFKDKTFVCFDEDIARQILVEYTPNEEPCYSLTAKDIDAIMDKCEVNVTSMFGKCTIVSCKLPNGFVLVEYFTCVDAKNYDEHIGVEICMNKIRDKIWELEGYVLQQKMFDVATKDIDDVDEDKKDNLENDCFGYLDFVAEGYCEKVECNELCDTNCPCVMRKLKNIVS